MPAVIIGTQMERGPSQWRFAATVPDEGPADGVLLIEFHGDVWQLPGFKGDVLDISELRAACPLVMKDWVPAQGNLKCRARLRMPALISVSLSHLPER